MSASASPVEFCRRLTRVNIAYTIARMKVIEARSRCDASATRPH